MAVVTVVVDATEFVQMIERQSHHDSVAFLLRKSPL